MQFKFIINRIKKILKYWVLTSFLLSFLFIGVSHAKDDLLWQIAEPAYEWQTIVGMGKNVDIEWKKVFEWVYELDTSFEDGGLHFKPRSWPSIIVKLTRLLLSLVVALSVTMILYNGMMYIINTWQWKEDKDTAKNVLYIVVWILLALFSVVIITVLQSIAPTLTRDIEPDSDNKIDNRLVEWERKWITWSEFFWWF